MRQELFRSLCEKYPNLFSDVDKPPMDSLMCFGCECGDGWYKLIDNACKIIAKNPNAKLVYVKEKFGQLRICCTAYTEEIEIAILKAGTISGKTCEQCGQPGIIRPGMWVRCVCDGCLDKGRRK